MSNSDPPNIDVPAGYMWHGQLRHQLLLAALLPGAWAIAERALDGSRWLGIEDRWWFATAIAGVGEIAQLSPRQRLVAQLTAGDSPWGESG